MPSSRSSNRSEPTRRAALATLGGLSLSVLACSTPKSKPHGDRQEALRQTVHGVMLPTFVELAEKTAILATATKAIDAASLPDVRENFRRARAVWNRSEAFLLGPSDDLALTGGAIDSWPAGIAALDALVAGTGALETAPANARGFPGIEQLLFDADATLEQPRRRAILAAQAAELASKCATIRDAWSDNDGYGYQLAEAGKGSTLFGTQKDAVDKIITAMVALAERMLVAKLVKPLGLDTGGPIRPDLEEAPKSDGSLAAIEHNLLGLRAVYNGGNDSLSRAVAALSANADATFRSGLDAALAAVAAVGEPMRVALAGDRSKLLALHAAVQVVKRSLVTDVASTLGASIGFGYSDTD